MISLTTYKVVHLLGIFLTLGGIGGIWALVAASTEEARRTARRLLLATHGVALLLVLVGGFGMIARLGITGSWPLWIWIKLTVWLLLAALPTLLRRTERLSTPLFFVAPILAAIAAWSALFHIGAAS